MCFPGTEERKAIVFGHWCVSVAWSKERELSSSGKEEQLATRSHRKPVVVKVALGPRPV